MHLFYTPDITGEQYTLLNEEAYHCMIVLRKKENDVIDLVDGKGGLYRAKIVAVHKKACDIHVISKEGEYGKRRFYLHIAIAPTKNMDRFEWFAEKVFSAGNKRYHYPVTNDTIVSI